MHNRKLWRNIRRQFLLEKRTIVWYNKDKDFVVNSLIQQKELQLVPGNSFTQTPHRRVTVLLILLYITPPMHSIGGFTIEKRNYH